MTDITKVNIIDLCMPLVAVFLGSFKDPCDVALGNMVSCVHRKSFASVCDTSACRDLIIAYKANAISSLTSLDKATCN